MKKIIGISGSPIENSNTDRTIKKILESSNLESEFIKLSKINVGPCRACIACVKTNSCVLNDDFKELEKKIREADAIIIGGYTPFGIIDAFTKALLERFYAGHHKSFLKDKLFVSVISSLDPKANYDAHVALTKESLVERMIPIGNIEIKGNFMCNKCGLGNECENSGIRRRHGDSVVASIENMLNVEDQVAYNQAEKIGEEIYNILINNKEPLLSEIGNKLKRK